MKNKRQSDRAMFMRKQRRITIFLSKPGGDATMFEVSREVARRQLGDLWRRGEYWRDSRDQLRRNENETVVKEIPYSLG